MTMLLSPENYKFKLDPKINDADCLSEIRRRCLSPNVKEYLHQCDLYSVKTKKRLKGLAFENDKKGYEIRVTDRQQHTNQKYRYGPQAISTFPAHPEAEDVTAFAFPQFWDFLTFVHTKGRPANWHLTVYHDDGLISDCAEAILKSQAKRVYHVHENSEAGYQADLALADELHPSGTIYGALNRGYIDQKDFSAWRMANPHGVYKLEPVYSHDHPVPGVAAKFRL